MYKTSFTSCLTTIFIFLLILFLIKQLWWFIVGLILISIVYYYAKLIYESTISKQINGEKNYNPQMGEVYKICPYCNSKVKVTAITCPVCNRALN